MLCRTHEIKCPIETVYQSLVKDPLYFCHKKRKTGNHPEKDDLPLSWAWDSYYLEIDPHNEINSIDFMKISKRADVYKY